MASKPTDAELMAKMRELEERIKAPSIWGRVACGLRFEDLQEKRYEEAVKLLKKHYLPEEITYRSLKMAEDREGTDEFTHNARIWMKDKMSIAAVKEGTEKLVGCLIMRIQEKSAFSRTFSRVKIQYNPLYSTVMTFYNEIEKPVDLFSLLGVKRYLKVYVLALKSRYRHRGVAKEFLKAALPLAASAKIAGIAGIFQTSSLHTIAENLGFQKVREIYYIRYLINNEIVFWNAGLGNYGAALMAYRIPNVDEPVELKPEHSSRFNIQIVGYVKEMLKAAILMCVNAHVPAIAGLFTTNRLQQIAVELGFEKYNEILYEKYVLDDVEVFHTAGLNTGAALMAYTIPGVEELEEIESQHSSRFNLQPEDEDEKPNNKNFD